MKRLRCVSISVWSLDLQFYIVDTVGFVKRHTGAGCSVYYLSSVFVYCEVVPILAVQGVKLVQMLLEAGNELGLFLPQDHRHGVGDGPLPVVDRVP